MNEYFRLKKVNLSFGNINLEKVKPTSEKAFQASHFLVPTNRELGDKCNEILATILYQLQED